jgi:hypothetical protein
MIPLLMSVTTEPVPDAAPVTTPSTVVSDTGVAPHVYLHSAYWPYERIGILKASNIQRASMWLQYGQANFTIGRNDPLLSTSRGSLQRGAFVVIESSQTNPWVGFVRELTESLTSGMIQVACAEVHALLDTKATRQLSQFSAGVGHIFSQVMRAHNARGHSGLFFPSIVPPGPQVVIELGGQTTFQALKELAIRSGYEFWPEYEASPSRINVTMQFGYRQGSDKADEITLFEGRNFSDLEYTLDTQGMRQSVTVYGGFATRLNERNAVTRSAGFNPGASELGTAVEPASELHTRFIDVPPALRSEDVSFRVMTADRSQLALEAERALEKNIGVAERYRMTINNSLNWKKLEVGDYVRVITNNTGLGAINRKVRIMGMQPSEESGQMALVVETPAQ